MPPKSSSAGRRRAARSTSRKSTAAKPVTKPSTEETNITNSSPETTPNLSSAILAEEDVTTVSPAGAIPSPLSVPLASPNNASTVDSTESQLSTLRPHAASVATSSEPAIGKDGPSNDDVLENQTVSKVAVGDATGKRSAEAIREDEAGLAPCEANPKTGSDANEGFLSPQPVQTAVENGDDSVAVISGQDDVVETTDASKDIAVNSGAKTKKTIKRTVKVVKKVIKKVPKRAVKGENDAKVDDLDKPDLKDDGLDQNSRPDCAVSNEAEAENLKPSVTVSLNVEDSNADVSLSNKVEESNQNGEPLERAPMEILEEKKSLEAQNDKEIVVMEVDEKEAEDVKKSALMEVDKREDGLEGQHSKDVAEKFDITNAMDTEPGKGNVDVGVGEGGVSGRDEIEGDNNVSKREDKLEINDKVPEGTYFSGELEAIERRKRRKTEIFIGGLDKDVKEEDIRKVFEEVGEVLDVRLLMNGKTGKNKGYAFLRYASAIDAKKALEKFSKVEICGKQCGVSAVEGNDTIYLGHIDKKWKEDDVLKLLRDASIEKIDKVTVMMDPNNIECNRGFAFVEMETSKDAQIAYKKLQKKDAFGKNHNIKVAWAEPLKELDEEELLKVKTVYAEFIPSNWDEEKVKESFKMFGEIDNIVLARNLRTSKRKDFAFISYETREAAIACIESFSRKLASDGGTKVNIKVSLAKPLPKGKQTKQVAKPVSKELPKEKPKERQSNLRPVDPRAQGKMVMHHYDSHRAERPSKNTELVHLLREQASWRQPQPSLSSGPVDIDYVNTLSGRKRPLSMLDADPLYSDLRYAHSHVETSFPVAGSSYNPLSPIGGTTSSGYYQHHGGYTSRLLYGTRNYPGNEVGERTDGRGIFYRRY
ncbi:hypothetical protein Ancab_015129 [Ancistrocladus abbreviatus]